MNKRNNEHIMLPNGCHCTQLTVNPRNWENKDAPIFQNWSFSYWFYDPTAKKRIAKQGMNEVHDLKSRQAITRKVLADEMRHLLAGFNPITGKTIAPEDEDEDDYIIHPDTPLCEALEKAFGFLEGKPKHKSDVKSNLGYIQTAIKALRFEFKPVRDVKKRHLFKVLLYCGKIKESFSNDRFNKYRSTLRALFKVLLKFDAVEHNPVVDIEVRKHRPKARHFITQEEREAIDRRLKIENYRFWNFMHLFFHSGARLAEMARVQGKHVDLEHQTVLYFVQKRTYWEWVQRPITDIALPFWCRAMIKCGSEQYVFAKALLPGDVAIDPNQYTRRWER